MPAVDLTTWAKSNVWRLPSGEMCARPGLRLIYSNDRELVGGFTIRQASTGEVWHYVFDVDVDDPPRDLTMRILDEEFVEFQDFAYGLSVRPRGISHAAVFDEVLIGSPDIPTVWQVLGSGARYATKQDSVSGSTAIDVPRGIWTSWNNRAVCCTDRVMSVSDPVSVGGGTIRSFIGENQNQRPGAVFGSHEGARGMLVLCTSEGVYALDSAASAVGVVGSNGAAWRKLSDLKSASYDSSCIVDGRVFALTKDGYALADVEDGDEERLTEPYQPRAFGPRVSMDDYRRAALLPGEHGPICAAETLNAAHFSDLLTGIASWWRSSYAPTDFVVRGILEDADGADLLLCKNGVFRVTGDFDGDAGLTSGVSTQPKAFFFGQIPGAPSQNRLVRHVHVGADVGAGGNLYAAVRGKALPSSSGTAGISDPEGLTIGTDVWGSSTKRHTTSSLQSVRFDFGEAAAAATDDVAVEVGANVCLTRIQPIVEVDYSESAERRPAKVA